MRGCGKYRGFFVDLSKNNSMVIPLKSRFIRMTEEEFFFFYQDMRDFHVERTADGTILIMELPGGETANLNAEVTTEVNLWNRKQKQGKTFDSSSGFTLPDSSVRSPDVAWVELEKWLSLPKEDRERFAHISPDFVIEIRSKTDRLIDLQQKMLDYRTNGVRLGWLIDPIEENVWIYRGDGTVGKNDSFADKISGDCPKTPF